MTTDDGALLLRCACGWEANGTEDEVVVAATEHGRRVHNMLPTRDEVLGMLVTDGGQDVGSPSAE
jgi:predicted small metal-binding protein